MNARGLAVLISLGLLAGCAATRTPPEPGAWTVELEGDAIIYEGPMSGKAIAAVADLLEAKGDQIDWLAIESPGGEVNWGLDLGELVLEHGLNVRVTGHGCHSSCANYVFPAGERKVIDPGAVVSWHGSALQRRWGFRARLGMIFVPAFRRYLEQWRERQADFYDRIAVDDRITIVGQDLGCECVWALSVEDMARFGLDDVEAPPDYREAELDGIRFHSRYRFIELPEDVFDRIRSGRTRALNPD